MAAARVSALLALFLAASANLDTGLGANEQNFRYERRLQATFTATASGSASASATSTATSSSSASASASSSSTPAAASATSSSSGSTTATSSPSASASSSSSSVGSASSTATGSASSTPSPGGGGGSATPTPSPSPSPAVVIDGHVLPTWFAVAVSGSLIGFGLFQVFFGYKFFRFTLFTLGFLTVGVTIFVLAWDHINDPNSMWYGVAMGALAGLLVGLVGALVPKIGVFLVGAALGVVAALILNTTVLYRLYPANPNVTLGVAGSVLGLALGGLATLMMRVVVVISTSMVGAYCTIRGIGYFAGNYPADEWALEDQIANGRPLPVAIYAYFAGILAFGLVGIVVQFMFTARKANAFEKDEWEMEYDDSEFSIAAITGKGKKKKKGKKGRKDSKKGSKKSKKSGGKDKKKTAGKSGALLDDYQDEYYDDAAYDYDDGYGNGNGGTTAGGGGGNANGGYDDYGRDYEAGDGGYDDEIELASYPSSGGGGGAGGGRGGGGGGGASSGGGRFGGWFGRNRQQQQAQNAIEW